MLTALVAVNPAIKKAEAAGGVVIEGNATDTRTATPGNPGNPERMEQRPGSMD